MGKDSEYYKNKKKDQILKYRELQKSLPNFAVEYLHSKELGTQTSTLISYSYDLLTFFKDLISSNPMYKNMDTDKFSIDNIVIPSLIKV